MNLSGGGDNEEQFSLVLTTEGADQSLAQINAVQDALAGVDEQTQALTASSQSLADILASPDAAQQLGLTTDELAQLADQLGVTLDTGAQLPGVFDDTDTSVKNLIQDIGDLGRDIEAIPSPDLSAFGVDDGSGDSGGGINPRALSAAGRLVGGSAGRALRGVGQASRLADALPDDSAALADLGAAGVIAAPAIIAVGIALHNYNDILAQGKTQLEGAITAQQNYYAALANDTTEQAQAQVAQLSKTDALIKQQIDETSGTIDKAKTEAASQLSIGGGQFGISEIGKDLANIFGAPVIGPLQDNLDKLKAEFTANEDTIQRLTQGLQNNAFSANNAAAAEQLLAQARQQVVSQEQTQIQQEGDFYAHAAQERSTATSESVKNEIQANLDQISIINNFEIPARKQEGLGYLDLTAKSATLAQQTQVLTDKVLPVIQAREDETAALQKQADALKAQTDVITQSITYAQQLSEQVATSTVSQVSDRLRGLQEENDAINKFLPELEQLAPTSKDAAAALDQAQTRLGALSDDYQDQITQVLPAAQKRALDEYQQAISDAQQKETQQATADAADNQQKLTQITADGAAKRASIVQDNADAINKIETQFASDDFTDIANRDAVADDQARKKEQLDLTNQQSSAAKQLNQEQLTQTQQETSQQQSYNKQINQLQTSLAQQDQTLTQKYQLDQNNLHTALNNQLTIQTTMYQQMAVAAAQGAAGVLRAFAGGFNAAGVPLGGAGNNPNEQPLNLTYGGVSNAVLQVLDSVLPSPGGSSGNRLIP